MFFVFFSICQQQWVSILGLGVVRGFFLPNPKIERNPLRNPGTLGNIKRNQKRNFVFSGRYSWVDWPSIFEVLSSIWFYWCSMEKWCTHFCSEIGSNKNRMVWIIVKSKTTCCKIYVICNVRTYMACSEKRNLPHIGTIVPEHAHPEIFKFHLYVYIYIYN